MLSFLFLFLAAPAVSPPGEAKITAFIAALPPSQRSHGPDPEIAARRAEAKTRFPARLSDVDVIFDAYQQCSAKAGEAEVNRSLRATALQFSEAELDSLITFYSGPDYKRFGALQNAAKAKTLTTTQKAEQEAIVARYPLEKFGKTTFQVASSFEGKDAFFAALGACDDARDHALSALSSKK